jgi:hypothetical protein
MKPLPWFVLVVVAAVTVTISFSQDPAPLGNAPEKSAESPVNGPATQNNKAALETPAETTWAPRHSFDYPSFPTGLPANLPPPRPLDKYVVLAWNDLGMHCYQADFSMFQILPPYNVFWAQVIQRGPKPAIVTQGVELHYEVTKVTDPVRHTNFWGYAAAYGWKLEPGVGLKGKRTSGTMEAATDHFIAEGVPVVDFNDDGTWDPFPMFTVSLQDRAGNLLAQTVNVAPASTEMSCDLCHVADSLQGSMAAILKAHDKNENTDLLRRAEAGKPVQCCSCHSDPAMGVTENKDCELSLSAAMHGFHASKVAEPERRRPKNVCHSCHPGPKTQCLRDIMSQSGITCTDCHGQMATVADRTRTPWTTMPSCTTCHTEDLQDPEETSIEAPNEHLTTDAASLYRHSKAHGGGGIYCCACHGSPHTITPAATIRDNEQAVRLQGQKGPIGKCTVCHVEEPDGEFWHFRKAE